MRVGKVIGKRKMAKHFVVTITDTSFRLPPRHRRASTAETAFDGVYVIRTSLPADQADAPAVVRLYKSLSLVERDFRGLKTIDLDLRPIHHYTETRVRGHVFLCVLARLPASGTCARPGPSSTFTDEHPPTDADPVAPARRSATADRKAGRAKPPTTASPSTPSAACSTTSPPSPATRCDFPTLDPTAHPSTNSRIPTPDPTRAFQLLDQPIPLTLA